MSVAQVWPANLWSEAMETFTSPVNAIDHSPSHLYASSIGKTDYSANHLPSPTEIRAHDESGITFILHFLFFCRQDKQRKTCAETTSLRLKRNEMKIETKHEKFAIATYNVSLNKKIPYISLFSSFSCPYILNSYIKQTEVTT